MQGQTTRILGDRHVPITKEALRNLYYGRTETGRYFRFGLLTFDIITIVFFIITSSTLELSFWIYVVDAILAVIIIADLTARWWIAYNRKTFFTEVATWTDIIVVFTLLLPTLLQSFLFLRILRALRVLRSYRVLADLRDEFTFFKRNEELLQSVLNLFVFIFVMTALVYVIQSNINPQISNYVDALYFTVTALTTTGFGDITLQGTSGRLLSVAIMVFGVALFLRLVQVIFQPTRVTYTCPDCGLKRHDVDAVHCKHCGRGLNIETDGIG